MLYSPKKFGFLYQAEFKLAADSRLKIWLSKPISSKYQKIDKFKINIRPSSIYKDEQGNSLLYFDIKQKGRISLNMSFDAVLFKEKSDIKTIKNDSFKTAPKTLRRYLKDEPSLEQTKDVKALVAKLTSEKENALEKITTFFDFVVDNFKYRCPVVKRGVKNLNLLKLRGDCGEYSSLFVAMMRSVGIPSRNITGFALSPKGIVVEHGWAEVYLKPLGWVPIDMVYTSQEKANKKNKLKYFLQHDDYRLVFCQGFNIPLKPAIPGGFSLNFWKELGLPITYDSTQILQPIIFASSNKVIFKDNLSKKSS